MDIKPGAAFFHAARRSRYKLEKEAGELLELLYKGKPLIVFDLETTGLSRNSDRILSFSAVRAGWDAKMNRLSILGSADIFMNPGFPIPPHVTQINHITNEMVEDCGTEDDVLPEIMEFIGPDPVLCGYNSHTFDVPFLNQACLRALGNPLAYCCELDVMRMTKDVFDLQNYKLENVAVQCGVAAGLTFHRSMDDVHATLRVLNLCLAAYRERLDPDAAKLKRAPVPLERITGYRHFRLSYCVNRLYIRTVPSSGTWYDFYKGEWVSDLKFDMEAIRTQTLAAHHVADETGLNRVYNGKKATASGAAGKEKERTCI